jgi:hypothetical protein
LRLSSSLLRQALDGGDDTGTKRNGTNLLSEKSKIHKRSQILEARSDGAIAGKELRSIQLSPDYKTRYLMLVGYDLSYMRYAAFKDLIESGTSSYSARHEATGTFEKAMGQIINTAGDHQYRG